MSLSLPVRPALGREDFLIAPANARAVAEIDRWRDWPDRKLVLAGPEGAGKSHLAAVWASETNAVTLNSAALPREPVSYSAVIVEAADRVSGDRDAEERLLHVHNHVLASGGFLLLTGRSAPGRWPIGLPDLASRLQASPVAQISPPDDQLLAGLLVKLFEDRQIAAPPDLITWCVPRMERSFAAAQDLVADLDSRALATGRPIGRKLAGEVLDAANATRQNRNIQSV